MPEVHERKMARLVVRRELGLFEPLDRVVGLTLGQQVGADVVVGISEIRIDFDRAFAFLDRVIDTAERLISPAAKGVGFGGRKHLDRLAVEINRDIELLDRFAIAFSAGECECANVMLVAFAPQLDRAMSLRNLVHPKFVMSREASRQVAADKFRQRLIRDHWVPWLIAFMIWIIAGPTITIIIAGRMKNTSGKRILTAVFCAASSARILRELRKLSEIDRSAGAICDPSCSL